MNNSDHEFIELNGEPVWSGPLFNGIIEESLCLLKKFIFIRVSDLELYKMESQETQWKNMEAI